MALILTFFLGFRRQGLIEATITLPTGSKLVGSPNLGKDFDKVEVVIPNSSPDKYPSDQERPREPTKGFGKWDAFMESPKKTTLSARLSMGTSPSETTMNTHLPMGSIPSGGVRPPEPKSTDGVKIQRQGQQNAILQKNVLLDFKRASDIPAPEMVDDAYRESPPTARKSSGITSFFGKPSNSPTSKSSLYEASTAATDCVGLDREFRSKQADAKNCNSETSSVASPWATIRSPPPKQPKNDSCSRTPSRPELASGWVSKQQNSIGKNANSESFWSFPSPMPVLPSYISVLLNLESLAGGGWRIVILRMLACEGRKTRATIQRPYTSRIRCGRRCPTSSNSTGLSSVFTSTKSATPRTLSYNPSRELQAKGGPCLAKTDSGGQIILAKLGKFYEMYERDAQLGHRLLQVRPPRVYSASSA